MRAAAPRGAQRVLIAAAVLLFAVISPARAAEWKAGVAKVKITPQRPIWMSGYASRDHAAERTLIDLWAKALVMEDPRGERVALVTLDLVGLHRDTSVAVRDELQKKYGLERRQIALCTSHTHTGPVVGHNLMAMYALDDAQQQMIFDYTSWLEEQIVAVVGDAIQHLEPVRLAWGTGHSTIAVNRRENLPEDDVPKLREQGLLKGPVDYDVPVLAVRKSDGTLSAIVFGYACHATVLSFYEWSGDYPGFAQIELEKSHPEATALFFAGCGADQNPLPRRTVERAQQYGKSLADSVDAALAGVMTPVDGELSTRYAEIPLPFDTLPTREELEKQSQDKDKYIRQRAAMLLKQIDSGKPLSQTYPYPVQFWQLGSDLQWITLGGEVVVDYSLRLKKELGPRNTWIAGYTNDVMAYIPSLRVLKEGRYEGATAMIYYGQPTSWGPQVEELIVKTVHELSRPNAGK